MHLIGYVLVDTKAVGKPPPGLLIIYANTRKVIGKGRSPYSALLLNAYLGGVQINDINQYGGRDTLVYELGNTTKQFFDVASKFFTSGGYLLSEVAIVPPLKSVLYFNERFQLVDKDPIYTVALEGVSDGRAAK